MIALGMLVAAAGWTGRAPGQDQDAGPAAPAPAGSGPPGGGLPIVVEAPADLEELWKRLQRPDFYLLTGEEYRKLLSASEPAPPGPSAVVESVAIRGEAGEDLAHLAIDYTVHLPGPGPEWVGLGLAGLTVSEAREDDRELAARVAPAGGWELKLAGQGQHSVHVELLVPLKTTPSGHRLEVPIPTTASTSLDVEVLGRPVVAATLGADEPAAIEPVDGGRRTRLSARLSPRSRVELAWSDEDRTKVALPPLLSAQGEIALDLDASAMRTRSTWAIAAIRGSAPTLALMLDPADELIELELDRQAVPLEGLRSADRTRLVVPLASPLRPGRTVRLMLATRRPLAEESGSLAFRGFPIEAASTQAGLLAVAQAGDLWLAGTAGPNLRRVDPRAELSEDLRSRPGTALAYQFLDQPFDLGLRVDRPEPRLRVESTTAVDVGAGSARVSSWFQYRASRGRAFEVEFSVPGGLELVSAGPPELVSATHWKDEVARADGSRRLTVRVAARPREADGFRLQLVGRQAFRAGTSAGLGLFAPLGATSLGGWIAVRPAAEVTVALDDAGSPGTFADEPPPPSFPLDWPAIPGLGQGAAPAALWLRHEDAPDRLPLRIERRDPRPRHTTSISARVARGSLEVEQETNCQVDFGGLATLDVAVPAALGRDWRLEGPLAVGTERVGETPEGDALFRLTFPRDRADSRRVAFRYRLALQPGLGDLPAVVEIPWIRPLVPAQDPPRLNVAGEPGVTLAPVEGGWTPATDSAASADDLRESLALQAFGVAQGAAKVRAAVVRLAPLPATVAHRLWLRTEQGAEGDLRTTARYLLETRQPSLSLALPDGAEWVRASVGGRAVEQVDRLQAAGSFRIRIPGEASAAGPIAVEVVYALRGPAAAGAWQPPRLMDGVVEQTRWEAVLPWNRAALGVPDGWVDENEWYWDRYVWKRRPWRDEAALAEWASAGERAGPTTLDPLGPPGMHAYLFSRPGPPAQLPVAIASRLVLVACASGTVLILGMLLLIRRPAARPAALAVAAAGVAAGVAVAPSITFQLAQSAAVGVFLLSIAALTQGLVERRRRRSVASESSDLGVLNPAAGSSQGRMTPAVGADDSTAVRPRPSTTRERIVPAFRPPDDEVYDLGVPRP